MTSPKKRIEMDVSEVDEAYESATVHGVITELSPVKSSSSNLKVKYFTGKMSDGSKTVRVVSFDPTLRSCFAKSMDNNEAIALSNCKVQATTSKATNCDFKLVASTKRCTVLKSDKEFNLPTDMNAIDPDVAKEVTLSEIPSCAVNQYVTVNVKVLEVSAPITVESKKTWREIRKQDTIVADATGTARLVLWQADIGSVEENHSYRVTAAHVRVYDEVYYLSASEQCEIDEIPDVGEVEVPEETENGCTSAGTGGKVVVGKIICVVSSEKYASCVMCSCKLSDSSTTFVQCDKCGAQMKKDNCKRSRIAKVVIESIKPIGQLQVKERVHVTIFDNVLSKIINSDGDLGIELLEAPAYVFQVKKNVVHSATPV